MLKITRRQFTRQVVAATAAPAVIVNLKAPKRVPIAFSTLGCPNWDWKKILGQASQLGYAAIEMRGLMNDIDLSKSPQFTGNKLKESLKDLDALGLKISDLGASARLGEPDPQTRAAQIDEAKRFIDLAHELKSPYVRVFGGKPGKGQSIEDVTDRTIAGFRELHAHAKGSKVTLLIESHDEFTTSPSLLSILRGTNLSTAALLWDAHSIMSEAPRLFEGRLPDLNLGTADGASCDPSLAEALVEASRRHSRYTHILSGRFKGGYITRQYGRPKEGVQAIQLEMALLKASQPSSDLSLLI